MDQRTTDKGWAAMRQLLDREMPVKNQRRIIWWWAGLLLLPLAGYGGLKWMGSDKSLNRFPEAVNVAPIASVETDTKARDARSTFQGKEKPAVNETQETKIAGSFKARNFPTLLKNQIQRSNSEKSPALLTDELADKNHPGSATSAGLAEGQKEQISALSAEAMVGAVPLDLLSISPQTIHSQAHTQTPFRPITLLHPIKPVQNTPFKRWAIGATSAISTERFSAINGFSTGITVDWNFARKWGLRSGAFYNIHTPHAKYRPVASVGSDYYTSRVDGNVIILDVATGNEVVNLTGTNFYSDSLTGNVFIPVSRLQRIEIPISVFWQAAKPLKVFAGASISRTLSAKADRQNYSGEYILQLTDQSAEDDASRLSSNELDHWRMDAMVGAGVRLSKMFELGFSAKMPFSDFKAFKSVYSENSFSSGLSSEEVGYTRQRNTPVFSLYGTLFF